MRTPSLVCHLFRMSSAVLLSACSLSAHDLWLVPSKQGVKGETGSILAASGMDFPHSVHAPDESSFANTHWVMPDGSVEKLEVEGVEDLCRVLRYRRMGDGIYIGAVTTNPRVLTLEADKFNEYLVSDGLPQVYMLRAREKSLDQSRPERYSKSPKVLLALGDSSRGDPTRVLGLPLEIVPLDNPFQLRVGQTIKVRVIFQGQTLPDAYLGWDHPGDGEPPTGTARTNADGEAMIPIAKTGLMTIRLIHMTRPLTDDYEWESFWTSLTFMVP